MNTGAAPPSSAPPVTWQTVVGEKLPFLTLAAAAGVVTVLSHSRAKAIGTRLLVDVLFQPTYRVAFYAAKTLFPVNLLPVYLFVPSRGGIRVVYLLAFAAVAGVTIVLFRLRRRWPDGLAAWAAHLTFLLPVLGAVQFGSHFAADRNTYLASLPWGALVAATIVRLQLARPKRRLRLLLFGAAGLFAVLGTLTFRQVAVWKDSLALWDHALGINPSLQMGYENRGYQRQGLGDLTGALADYDMALRLNDRSSDAYVDRGNVRVAQGDFARALADYERALAIAPTSPEGHNGRGAVRAQKGDLTAALADFNEALRLKPIYPEALNNRGRTRTDLGDIAGALADFDACLRLDPSRGFTYLNRGEARAAKGDVEGAISDFTAAIAIGPPDVDAFNERGVAYATKGDVTRAKADFDRALAIDPHHVGARTNRGHARAEAGDLDGALTDYEEAIRVNPSYPDAFLHRGTARAQKGQLAAARSDFETALRVAPANWRHRQAVLQLIERAKSQ